MKDVLQIQVSHAVKALKEMSDKETDKLKKLDIDYVITVLTNKKHGDMPFQEDMNLYKLEINYKNGVRIR